MSEPMSQSFVTAFITTCFEEGLSKEAAASLLQKESTDRALSVSEPWTAGYLSVAAQVPGNLRPMLFTDGSPDIEKAANIWRGVSQAGRGIWDATKGFGNIGRSILGKGRAGASKAFNTKRPDSFISKYPGATALASAAGATGLGVGGYHLATRDRGLMGPYGESDPFFGPGGYDGNTYDKRYESRLYDDYAPGIFEHNKEYNGTAARRKELEQAVRENKGGGQSYRELMELNRRHAELAKQRSGHYSQLGDAQSQNRQLLDGISQRQQGLEKQRTAWWAAPKRWWLDATGRDSQQYYDKQIGSLEDSAQRARMNENLLGDRKRLLDVGATGRVKPTQLTPDDVQRNFFPTY